MSSSTRTCPSLSIRMPSNRNRRYAVECNDLVVDYFETILECIREENNFKGCGSLNHLHRAQRDALGLVKGRPRGRGVAGGQASDLIRPPQEQ